jgi:hypothetical protein
MEVVTKLCLAMLVLCVSSLASAAAQSVQSSGAINGLVVDQQTGQAIAGAAVQIAELKSSLVTDQLGRFTVSALAPGTYHATISIVGYILARREIIVAADQTVEVTIPLAGGTGTYREEVTVRGEASAPDEPAVAAQQTLGSAELQNLRGVMVDDPLRAVQALPGVSATDDLHGVFTVRGSGFDRIGFTLNGVPTRYVLHTVEAVEGGGSTAMINGDILARVSLMSGAYPQRIGGRTGAQVAFELREGSRDRQSSRLAISGSSISFVSEGPLGSNKRGSWLISARKSYLDFLFEQVFDDPTFTFGFEDVQAHLVRDVGARHQIQATVIGGQSRFNEREEDLGDNDLFQARLNGWLGALRWRYLAPHGLIVSQHVYAAGGDYRNVNRHRVNLNSAAGRDIGYRADVSQTLSNWTLLEGGAQVNRITESGEGVAAFGESRTAFGGYAQLRLSPSSRVVSVAGARVDRWASTECTDVSPWLTTEWKISDGIRVLAGAGIHRQPPAFSQAFGFQNATRLTPEVADHVDVAFEHAIGRGIRWRLGGFARRERDVIDLVDGYFRMGGIAIVRPAPPTYANILDGRARGLELSVHRTAPAGVSGWIAYSLGKLEYTDTRTGERFPGTFDERHSLTANAMWRISNRTNVTTRFRASSNFPIPGYYRQQEESFGGGGFLGPLTMNVYYLGDQRNQLRLPWYSRLDVRANRTYTWEQRRLTLFVEVTNVYNRSNQRYTGGDINGRTGRVSGLTEELFPILPSAGLLIEF